MVTAVSLAACGSSGSSNSSPTTAGAGGGGSATTAGGTNASGAPLVVGEIDTQSGATTSGTVTDLHDTIKLWVNYINSHGGINGHPVKVIAKDDTNNPANSLADVQQFVTGNHVIAIFDGSGQDAAWTTFVTQNQIPVISTNQAGDGFQFQSQPDFFANGGTVLAGLWGQLKSAAVAGAAKYGLIYCTEEPACAQAVPATKGLAQLVPIKVVYVAGASNTQPNYTAVCLGAKSAGAQAVFAAGVAPGRVADDCAKQDFKPIWITAQGTVAPSVIKDPNLASATGPLQDFPWMLDSTPAQKLFHQIEDGELAKAQTQANVDFAYVGAQLFEAAAMAGVSASNTAPSAQDIYNGLYGLHNETLGGLAPPLNFVKGKANPVNCVFFYGVKNGVYAAPYGSQLFCEPQTPG
jgi:branched-chain amino acid transport system substrate-binding protein